MPIFFDLVVDVSYMPVYFCLVEVVLLAVLSAQLGAVTCNELSANKIKVPIPEPQTVLV